MYGKKKTVIGFAPTRRHMYDKSFAVENRKEIEKVTKDVAKQAGAEILDIDWLNEDGLLMDLNDVEKVENYFRQHKADALFMPHCNFGTEEVVGRLGKALGLPFLLWGPRDDVPPENFAVRQTDCQCGLFASSKVLSRYGVPFTYIENSPVNSGIFKKGLADFIRTAAAVSAFRHLRIGKICQRPRPFLSVMINESELLEKFGIEIVPIEISEVLAIVKEYKSGKKGEVQERIDDIKGKMDCGSVKAGQMENIAALEFAITELAKLHDCSVMTSECWREYFTFLGIGACFVFGDVTDRGLPVACETDVCGAVTSALLTAIADEPGFLADLTLRHPTNDNSELLWHCGPFPQTLAKPGAPLSIHECKGRWELKGGELTIARFDGIGGQYRLFAQDVKTTDGPSTNGNYVWIETENWPEMEKKFIYGPYIHHVAGAYGKYAAILHEACKYIGVTPDFV